ncbi:MAG TPA: hypothetical protein VLJ58_19950 [Ramlibacter sp.]|nr:hypothetical protein [Ramlibacter sp.]
MAFKLTHTLIPVIAATTMAGCTSVPIGEIQGTLAQARSCCSSHAELPIEALAKGTRTKFDLSTASPIFRTPEGLGYIAAFELPPGVSMLSLQSLYTSYLPKSTYVDPGLMLLDAGKQVLAQRNELPLRKGSHWLVAGLYEHYYGANMELPPDAKYVIVFANVQAGRTQETASATGKLWPVRPAPVGTLAVIVR